MDRLNRAQRRAVARQTARSAPLSEPRPDESAVPEKGDIVTVEWPDMTLSVKCTEVKLDPFRGVATASFVPLEDSVHPVPLSFPPPLAQFSSDGGKAIGHHWEKLTYVFGLPNPAEFPSLPVPAEDRQLIAHFIRISRQLAGYSVINDNHELRVTSGGGEWRVEATIPTAEAFAGTSVALRQLHSGQEEASFDKVKGRLFQAIAKLPEEQRESTRATLTKWAIARADLMNHTLDTLVCRKATNAKADDPVSFRDIRPEELIATYNYGGTIHFGKHRDTLVDLLSDPTRESYHSFACITSIAGLSHLYFGFAVLLQSALGEQTGQLPVDVP